MKEHYFFLLFNNELLNHEQMRPKLANMSKHKSPDWNINMLHGSNDRLSQNRYYQNDLEKKQGLPRVYRIGRIWTGKGKTGDFVEERK